LLLAVTLFAQDAPPPQPPQIVAPADVVLSNDRGRCSASGLILGTPAARDFAGGHTITVTRNDDAPMTEPFPRGQTVITWTVTDLIGQTTSVTQTITVKDQQPPRIDAPPDVEAVADDGCFATHVDEGKPAITAGCDDYRLAVIARYSDGRETLLPSDERRRYPIGITTLTWTVTDLQGRQATASSRITVKSEDPPQITAPPDVEANTNRGRCAAFVNVGRPDASDKCSIASVEAVRSDGKRRPDMPYPAGRTTIIWTATNA
jgi:hypothetical protein